MERMATGTYCAMRRMYSEKRQVWLVNESESFVQRKREEEWNVPSCDFHAQGTEHILILPVCCQVTQVPTSCLLSLSGDLEHENDFKRQPLAF